MTFKDLLDVAAVVLRRTDIPLQVAQIAFRNMMREIQRKTFLSALRKVVQISFTNPFGAPVPSDFYDDILVQAVRNDVFTVYPLATLRSKEQFYFLLQTDKLAVLQTSFAPTSPAYYIIAKPSEIFSDAATVFTSPDTKHILVYPPLDKDLYHVRLTYLSDIVSATEDLHDGWTTPLMDEYPEWIQEEFLYRLALLVRDDEAAQIHKALAAERYLDVVAKEAEKWLKPHPQVALPSTPTVFDRRPLPGPKVPEK